jgi:hypothetical protein
MRRPFLFILVALFGCAGRFAYTPSPPSFSQPALPETALAPFTFEGHRFAARTTGSEVSVACPVIHNHRNMPALTTDELGKSFVREARSSGAFRSIRLIADPERGREKLSLQIAVNECVFRYRPDRKPAYEFRFGLHARAVALTDGRVVWSGKVRREAQGDWAPPGSKDSAVLVREIYSQLIKDLAAGVLND